MQYMNNKGAIKKHYKILTIEYLFKLTRNSAKCKEIINFTRQLRNPNRNKETSENV